MKMLKRQQIELLNKKPLSYGSTLSNEETVDAIVNYIILIFAL